MAHVMHSDSQAPRAASEHHSNAPVTPALIALGAAYCGKQLPPRADARIVALEADWILEDYLERMQCAAICLDAASRARQREFFLEAAQTEFDAEHLCRFLERSGIELSPEFSAFERAWRFDEHRHYLGFLRIYARLFPDTGEVELARQIESAVPDFEPVHEFLRDEFHVLAAIAYDEDCTACAYGEQIGFYKKLGEPVFAEWLRLIAHDEVNHRRNAIAVLRARHLDRLAELPELFERFVAHDLAHRGYRNTFLFDHGAYSEQFLRRVAERLSRSIRE
jgi:hypothetical protein